jgi:DNA-binding NarL/FixJ family response regulator
VTTIVLADDHPAVRRYVRELLEEEPAFHIIGEASDGVETTQIVEHLQPHVLVLDLIMEGMNGIEVTQQVVKTSPKTRVVIYSMYGNEAYVVAALRAGAKAYVLKESASDELVRAIYEVVAGHVYLPAPLSQTIIDEYQEKADNAEADT